MRHATFTPLACAAASALLLACGGGDPAAQADIAQADGQMTAQAVNDSQRIAAATATANSSSNACQATRPFYWEVGSGSGKMASGSVSGAAGTPNYGPNTVMPVASASKWLYAAYVMQRQNGVLSAADQRYLGMGSGYISMYTPCLSTQTVGSCLAYNGNGLYTPQAEGRFYYGSGHMQAHANAIGLAALNTAALATEMKSRLGTDLTLSYNQPQLAAGAYTTADSYGRFLRKLLNRQLVISDKLGANAVCTNPNTCALGTALFTPTPAELSWHYAAGHWVEDDTVRGDGAFSSPGALGFYPWIDASRSYYGVLARAVAQGWNDSTTCGGLIRKAWMSGATQ